MTPTTCTMTAPWRLTVPGVGVVEIRSPGPYTARPAKDNDDAWPYWYVAGPDGRLNVCHFGRGAVLCTRRGAEIVAEAAMAASRYQTNTWSTIDA